MQHNKTNNTNDQLFSHWNGIVEAHVRLDNANTSENTSENTTQYTTCHILPELPAEIWDQWLWHTNPQEAPTAELMLNQCQLLGLLICRYRAVKHNAIPEKVMFSHMHLTIVDKEIC